LGDRLATDVPARVACDESRHFHQSGPRIKRRSINRAHHVGNKAPDDAARPIARVEFFASPRAEALPLPRGFAHIGNGVARAPRAEKRIRFFSQSAL